MVSKGDGRTSAEDLMALTSVRIDNSFNLKFKPIFFLSAPGPRVCPVRRLTASSAGTVRRSPSRRLQLKPPLLRCASAPSACRACPDRQAWVGAGRR